MTLLSDIKQAYLDARLWWPRDDNLMVDYVYATVITNSRPGQWEPLWDFLAAPPSYGKSELVRPFVDTAGFLKLTTMTGQTWMSGYEDEKRPDEDPSILSKIAGKVLLITDFTAIASLPHREVVKILGGMREAFDGTSDPAFGNIGNKRKYRDIAFNMIACATPAVDLLLTGDQAFGQRIMMFRAGVHLSFKEREDIARRAILDREGKGARRKELKKTIRILLDRAKRRLQVQGISSRTPKEVADNLAVLGTLVASLRTCCLEKGYTTDPEAGQRLALQLGNLMDGRAFLDERDDWNDEDQYLAKRVARDSLPPPAFRLAKAIWRRPSAALIYVEAPELFKKANCSAKIFQGLLDQWAFLDMIERNDNGWRFKAPIRERLEATKLLENRPNVPL